MRKSKGLSYLILFLSMFISIFYGYAETNLPETSVKLVVEESYMVGNNPLQGVPSLINIFAIERLLRYANLKILPQESSETQDADVKLKVTITGIALGDYYSLFGTGTGTYYYTGASVEGAISLMQSEESLCKKIFSGRVEPPSRIYPTDYSTITVTGALFHLAFSNTNFISLFATMLGERYGILFFINALQDEDWSVRRIAIDALVTKGDTRAVEPLINALRNQDLLIQSDAARGLIELDDTRAVEPLISALKDKESSVRMYAADILGKLGDIRAIEPLINALNDQDSSVRQYVAEALGTFSDTRAVEPLIDALRDEDPCVRYNAAKNLGKLSDDRAVGPLINALKDQDISVRQYVVEALGNLGDAKAVEPVIKALKDDDFYVRYNAAKALGDLGDARAVEPLINALKNDDKQVREEVVKALQKITQQSFGEEYGVWLTWWQKQKTK